MAKSSFDKLKDLMKLKMVNEFGFTKFMKTGELEIQDYDIGFVEIEVYYFTKEGDGGHCVRIWFESIDDCDFGAFVPVYSSSEGIELVNKLANIFKDMDSLPNKVELNKILEPFNVYVDFE